jgi:hypothetical protein
MHPKEELPVRTAACTAIGLVIQQDQSNQHRLIKTKGAIESLVGKNSVTHDRRVYRSLTRSPLTRSLCAQT